MCQITHTHTKAKRNRTLSPLSTSSPCLFSPFSMMLLCSAQLKLPFNGPIQLKHQQDEKVAKKKEGKKKEKEKEDNLVCYDLIFPCRFFSCMENPTPLCSYSSPSFIEPHDRIKMLCMYVCREVDLRQTDRPLLGAYISTYLPWRFGLDMGWSESKRKPPDDACGSWMIAEERTDLQIRGHELSSSSWKDPS